MAVPALTPMTVEEFLVWQRSQEERYELVEGFPVKLTTGASEIHDLIATNVIAALHAPLRGQPCRPTTADIGLRTKLRSLRRPDVTVTCNEPRPDSYEARHPRLAVEVLSPSNTGMPWHRKLEEYRQLTGLEYILLIASDAVAATLIRRDGGGCTHDAVDDRDGVIELPAIGCRLRMADVYEGVRF